MTLQLKFESTSKKYSPIYELRIVTKRSGQPPKALNAANPYSSWFDQLGYFVPKPFHAFVSNSVPDLAKEAEVVGSATETKKQKQKK